MRPGGKQHKIGRARHDGIETTMSDTGVLICGHGSRDVEAVREFELLAAALRPRFPDYDFATGYLEFARPTIRDGLTALTTRGAKRIYAVPGMLFAASHIKNDLPWEMNSFLAGNPGVDVRLGRDLGVEVKLINAAADRIAGAVPGDRPRDFSDSLLVTVGRGTNDPDANSNIAKISRMLWEGLGFGWAEVAFSGVAHPRVDAALDRAARLGFRRIVVFPYFLFTGVLVKRIYDQTDAAALRFPEIEFVKAPYLRDHPLLLDAFVERVGEIEVGSPAMNCQLCKYRTQIVGYETEIGAVQTGHHHHVRGIGTDADHHHGHDGGHHHDHPHR
jgi:sirohydrochlorin cobaltochelatase